MKIKENVRIMAKEVIIEADAKEVADKIVFEYSLRFLKFFFSVLISTYVNQSERFRVRANGKFSSFNC